MATSGSRDFTLDVADLIEEAYERCGFEMRTGYDAQTARRSLNLLFSEWANRGVNLWTVKLGTLSLVANDSNYQLDASIADILEVVVRRDSTDYEVDRISRSEYHNLPNKTSTGRPSQFYFNRQTTPEINVWPAAENSTDQLRYYYVQRIEDADALVNDVDAPFRFLPCMASGLAYYLAVKRAPDRVQMLKTIYEEEFQRAADEDEDRVPLKLTPSIRYLR